MATTTNHDVPSDGDKLMGEMHACRASLRWAEAEILITAHNGDVLNAEFLQNTKFNLKYRCDVLRRRYREQSKRGPFRN
jgi:hypothetical protein